MTSSWKRRIHEFLYSEAPLSPREELRLLLADQALGWVKPAVADAILRLRPDARKQAGSLAFATPGADYASRSAALQALAEALHDQGLIPGWRGEAMVLHDTAGQPWAQLERAAFRTLGLQTQSVHLNAFVMTDEGVRMWVARRSSSKSVDPDMLDNLVGGGIIGLEGIASTLQREGWEEAGLRMHPLPLPRARLHVQRYCAHGIQDEIVHVHDLWIRPQFSPQNQDGEVATTYRLELPEVAERLLAGEFTRDAALVILDGLCRQWFFGAETPAVASLTQSYGIYS